MGSQNSRFSGVGTIMFHLTSSSIFSVDNFSGSPGREMGLMPYSSGDLDVHNGISKPPEEYGIRPISHSVEPMTFLIE